MKAGGGEPQPPGQDQVPRPLEGVPKGEEGVEEGDLPHRHGEGLGVQKTPSLAEGPPHPQKDQGLAPPEQEEGKGVPQPLPQQHLSLGEGEAAEGVPRLALPPGQGGRGQQEAEDPQRPPPGPTPRGRRLWV